MTLFVAPSEQPLLGSLLTPPLAYRLDATPLIEPASLPAKVWSYDLNPGDVTLGFCSATPANRDIPALLRNLDPASLHITEESGHYFICSANTRLGRLSQKSPTATKQWPAPPPSMAVESPILLVRETADEQDFVILASLTTAT